MSKSFNKPQSSVLKRSVLCLFAGLCLFGISGCGSSSDDDDAPITPPVSEDYPQKIAIITQTSTHVFFSVEVAVGRYELYSANLATGQRTAITDFYSANNGLRPMGLNFDGTRIAYRADKDLDGTDELYTNLIDGSNEAQVTNVIGTSTTDNSGTVVHYNWQWLFASTSLVFRSDPDADGIFEIQTATLDGTSLAVVSADLSVKCLAADCWKTASDGRVITFMVESTNQNSEVEQNLYRVLTDGSGLTQLNQSLATDTRLHDWQWSNDGSLIAFISQDIGSLPELNMVDPNSFVLTPLSRSGLSLGVTAFAWAPDDSRIAFSEDGDTAGVLSLYSILPDGNDRHQLIDTSVVATPSLFEWSWGADSSRVAYRADQNLTGVVELFTVAADGQFHRKMNSPMSAENSIQANWQWSPDGQFIAFHADIETAQSADELYASAADGSVSVQLNTALTSGASLDISNSQWSNDNSRVVYQVIDPNGQAGGLYSVLAIGNDQARLNDSLQTGQSILTDYKIAHNSTRVAFQIVDSANSVGLQLADLDGANRFNVRTLGFASSPTWSIDSSRVLYIYKTDEAEAEQLFSVLANGSGQLQIY